MYQRVLVTLFALFLAGASFGQSVFNSGDQVVQYVKASSYGSASNPDSTTNNVIRKWVFDPLIKFGYDRINNNGWTIPARSTFKCYYVNGMPFRLRYPNNYDSTNASKYPVVIFWHGGGEKYGWLY